MIETENNRLRHLREKESLTQSEVATALHIGQSTYNRYERGVREPDHETLKLIADYFHVSIDFLLRHDRPYTKKEAEVDLVSFILDGAYKVQAKTPTKKDRKKLAQMVEVILGN